MARKQMSRKLPSLKALRTFEAAARLLSFTKAADELFVTHGAVSQQIKVLEQHFGQPLFVRSHGGVRLSAAGEELLPVIGECLDRLERVSSRLTLNRDAEILTVADTNVVWSVCAFGSTEASCMLAAAEQGGHARVGFENNMQLPNGKVAKDNAALVAEVANGISSMGRQPASCSEARLLLGMD